VKDPYAVLGVPRNASDAQIRYAYRQALREDGSGDEIEEAYRVLSDPRRRRALDGPPARSRTNGEPSVTPLPVLQEAEEKVSRNPFMRLTRRLPRPYRIAIDWILTIAGAVAIVLAIKAWVVNPYRIPSSSMEPTLHCARSSTVSTGCEAHFSDRVLANRFIFHFRNPNRGEIVVFDAPARACSTGGTFVKRLIGLPGDRIKERDGRFFINGKKLDDTSWVKPGRRDDRSGSWVVPKDSYFFVGDNRGASCDSRAWGSVPRHSLIGPVFSIYWPPNRIWVSTPGTVGASILAGIVALLVFAVVALRRHRRARAATH
jgi:signal peptidase I